MTNNKLNKYNKLRTCLNIIYTIFNSIFGFLILINLYGVEILDLPVVDYFTILFSFCFVFIIVYFFLFFINIIFHELGHLIFGLFAKLKFVSFNILCFTISKNDNKLSIKQDALIPGVYGYCSMEADDNITYESNKIKLYFMGGILIHFISILINLIILVLTNNIYLDSLLILNITMNLYLAIYNALPCVNKSGTVTDSLHIIYFIKDNNYIRTISKLNKLQRMIRNGTKLKNINSSFFTKPKTFESFADVLNGKIYIDFIMDKEKYKETINFCKKMLKDENELLTKQDIISIKLQLILAIFYSNKNLDEMKELWNDDIKKYVDLMSSFSPYFIGVNYLYFNFIEKDLENANKCLNQLKKLNRKKYDKYQIEELEKLIFDVNKRAQKNH